MSRTWTIFMGIAILMMLAVFAYEFYISISGGNVTFSKTVTPIEATLGTSNIATFSQYYPNVLVRTEYLDDK